MKTTRKKIDKELKELDASFLLKNRKKDVKIPAGLNKQILDAVQNLNEEEKTSKNRRLLYFFGSVAASLILGLFIFNLITLNKPVNQFSWENITKEDVLIYIEDDLTNYTEDDLLTLVNTQGSENLFDNSGISDEFIKEYIFNQLNEEIQLEDLL